MIAEIQIYTDTSVISLDEYKCLVPIASGSWEILKDIYKWMIDPYPGRIPSECRINHCDIFIIDRSNINNKIPITINNFKKIGKFLTNLNIPEVPYTEVIENIIPLIVENNERE